MSVALGALLAMAAVLGGIAIIVAALTRAGRPGDARFRRPTGASAIRIGPAGTVKCVDVAPGRRRGFPRPDDRADSPDPAQMRGRGRASVSRDAP